MEDYFILGGSELQLDFIQTVQRNGYCAHVIDYDNNCIGANIADVFHCVSINDKETVLNLAIKYKPIAIHTVATEQGNITACYVGEKLGLNCNSYQTALNTTNKYLMKKVLLTHNLATPTSVPVKNQKELEMLTINYPVMVKASDRSAARGVRLVNNKTELFDSFDEALDISFNKVVLIEEYFDAPQYSIETLSSAGVHQIIAITAMEFSGPPNFIATVDQIPALIDETMEAAIHNYAHRTLEAFNIQVGACHIEVRINSGGIIKMIEIASRMGGWRHWMILDALGIDYCQAVFDATLKQPTSTQRTIKNKISITRYITNAHDLALYKQKKNEGVNIFIDTVKQIPLKNDATNLINIHGYYVYNEEN